MSARATALRRLARPSGGFAMVALDHREAMRGMFRDRDGRWPDDRQLAEFKILATETLSPVASAMLLDRQYGLRPVLEAKALAAGCGSIVAADELIGPPGGAAVDSRLDDSVDPEEMCRLGAAALKLLVVWRPDEDPSVRRGLVTRFIERCRKAGLLAVIEGVARPPLDGRAWDPDEGILDAARELGQMGPDLYKAEVPMRGRGRPEAIRERCRALNDALPCPWVVLSSGVETTLFPSAVGTACEGGASGFLAGRAIWADALRMQGDMRLALAHVSVPRLRQLCEIVDSVCAVRADAALD